MEPDNLADQLEQKARGLTDFPFFLVVADELRRRNERILELSVALKDQKAQTDAFEELANSRRSVSR